MVLVINGILVFPGHTKASGRAGKGAQGAIAAKGHVDVENNRAQLFYRAVRCENLRLVFSTLLRLNRDAICGTDTRTLAAANTILDFVQ